MADYQKKRDDAILKWSTTPEQESAKRALRSAVVDSDPEAAEGRRADAMSWDERSADKAFEDYEVKVGNMRPVVGGAVSNATKESSLDEGDRPAREVEVNITGDGFHRPFKAGPRPFDQHFNEMKIAQLPPEQREAAMELNRRRLLLQQQLMEAERELGGLIKGN